MPDKPITCYLIDPESDAVDIRPASNRRAWMGETVGANAYRCLPLVMANQHGWALHAPAAIEATWDGSSDWDSVTVTTDGPGPACARSNFGSGILTFSVGAVFRTAPGYNLWVTGPTNSFKDGIQAMSALIETDWLPYTFSVNWKFTRPGHSVRFEKGEPICMMFPVPRGIVEACRPEIRPLASEPALERQQRLGLLRRNAWVIKEQTTGVTDPAIAHQGWYMRGQNPEETERFEDHQTALRVPPFKRPED